MEREAESSVVRHFVALGAGFVSAAAAFAGPFGCLATWNGALTRFEQRHYVLAIVLGVSVFFLGCVPALVGARALVAPDQGFGEYRHDNEGHRIHVGSVRYRESTAGALRWLAFGWLWSALIGAAFYLGGS
jgi:hypothetical protein